MSKMQADETPSVPLPTPINEESRFMLLSKEVNKLWLEVVEELRRRKDEKTLKGTHLAKAAGLSRGVLYKYIDGSRGGSPSITTVFKLAEALEFSMSRIIGTLSDDAELVEAFILLSKLSPESVKHLAAIVSDGGEGSDLATKQLKMLAPHKKE